MAPRPIPDADLQRLLRRVDLAEHRQSELWGWIQGWKAARDHDGGLRRLALWLETHEELHELWPASDIRALLAPCQYSTPLAHAEREAIARGLAQFGRDLGRVTEQRKPTPQVRYDAIPAASIEFNDRHIVFTGDFACTRIAAETATAGLGANVRGAPARKGDYLVVGTYAAPGWKHSGRGRKIEQIEQWRAEGATQCRIISERTWAEAVLIRHRESIDGE